VRVEVVAKARSLTEVRAEAYKVFDKESGRVSDMPGAGQVEALVAEEVEARAFEHWLVLA